MPPSPSVSILLSSSLPHTPSVVRPPTLFAAHICPLHIQICRTRFQALAIRPSVRPPGPGDLPPFRLSVPPAVAGAPETGKQVRSWLLPTGRWLINYETVPSTEAITHCI